MAIKAAVNRRVSELEGFVKVLAGNSAEARRLKEEYEKEKLRVSEDYEAIGIVNPEPEKLDKLKDEYLLSEDKVKTAKEEVTKALASIRNDALKLLESVKTLKAEEAKLKQFEADFKNANLKIESKQRRLAFLDGIEKNELQEEIDQDRLKLSEYDEKMLKQRLVVENIRDARDSYEAYKLAYDKYAIDKLPEIENIAIEEPTPPTGEVTPEGEVPPEGTTDPEKKQKTGLMIYSETLQENKDIRFPRALFFRGAIKKDLVKHFENMDEQEFETLVDYIKDERNTVTLKVHTLYLRALEKRLKNIEKEKGPKLAEEIDKLDSDIEEIKDWAERLKKNLEIPGLTDEEKEKLALEKADIAQRFLALSEERKNKSEALTKLYDDVLDIRKSRDYKRKNNGILEGRNPFNKNEVKELAAADEKRINSKSKEEKAGFEQEMQDYIYEEGGGKGQDGRKLTINNIDKTRSMSFYPSKFHHVGTGKIKDKEPVVGKIVAGTALVGITAAVIAYLHATGTPVTAENVQTLINNMSLMTSNISENMVGINDEAKLSGLQRVISAKEIIDPSTLNVNIIQHVKDLLAAGDLNGALEAAKQGTDVIAQQSMAVSDALGKASDIHAQTGFAGTHETLPQIMPGIKGAFNGFIKTANEFVQNNEAYKALQGMNVGEKIVFGAKKIAESIGR